MLSSNVPVLCLNYWIHLKTHRGEKSQTGQLRNWKHRVEKSQLRNWKHTVEKSLRQANWGIENTLWRKVSYRLLRNWKHTVEKSQLRNWKHTVEKSLRRANWGIENTHSGERIKDAKCFHQIFLSLVWMSARGGIHNLMETVKRILSFYFFENLDPMNLMEKWICL